jgi:hypothetical protein
VLIGASHSQKIAQFHIETGSSATLYLHLFASGAWLRAILQDRLSIGQKLKRDQDSGKDGIKAPCARIILRPQAAA